MKKKEEKPYWEMTAEELAEATKEFDEPFPLSKTRAMTKAERARFEKMQKAPHRSVYIPRRPGEICVRLDPEIVDRSMKFAAKQKLTLSELINRSLKGLLTVVD